MKSIAPGISGTLTNPAMSFTNRFTGTCSFMVNQSVSCSKASSETPRRAGNRFSATANYESVEKTSGPSSWGFPHIDS